MITFEAKENPPVIEASNKCLTYVGILDGSWFFYVFIFVRSPISKNCTENILRRWPTVTQVQLDLFTKRVVATLKKTGRRYQMIEIQLV